MLVTEQLKLIQEQGQAAVAQLSQKGDQRPEHCPGVGPVDADPDAGRPDPFTPKPVQVVGGILARAAGSQVADDGRPEAGVQVGRPGQPGKGPVKLGFRNPDGFVPAVQQPPQPFPLPRACR